MASIVPELRLYEIALMLVNQVEVDYNSKVDKKDTLLYGLFGDATKLGKYNYLEEAKNLFVGRKNGHPRKVDVRLMFDAAQADVPTMHITAPSEQSQYNTIGVGESGLADNVNYNGLSNTNTPNYNRRFQAQYYIVCTSESSQEVFLMYQVLKAAFTSALDYVNLAGLENPVLSGQEIRQREDMAPNHIYMKGLGISFFYELNVPRYFDTKVISELTFTPNAQTEITGTVTD